MPNRSQIAQLGIAEQKVVHELIDRWLAFPDEERPAEVVAFAKQKALDHIQAIDELLGMLRDRTESLELSRTSLLQFLASI